MKINSLNFMLAATQIFSDVNHQLRGATCSSTNWNPSRRDLGEGLVSKVLAIHAPWPESNPRVHVTKLDVMVYNCNPSTRVGGTQRSLGLSSELTLPNQQVPKLLRHHLSKAKYIVPKGWPLRLTCNLQLLGHIYAQFPPSRHTWNYMSVHMCI